MSAKDEATESLKSARELDSEHFTGCVIAALVGGILVCIPIGVALWDEAGSKQYYMLSGVYTLVRNAAIPGGLVAIVSPRLSPAGFVGTLGGVLTGGAYWFLWLTTKVAQSTASLGAADVAPQFDYGPDAPRVIAFLWILVGCAIAIASYSVKRRRSV